MSLDRVFKILIVEDSQTQAMSLQFLIEAQGWEAVPVLSAEAAIKELGASGYDLIIMDFFLPGIRGDELCRRIRMNFSSRSIPIILLTANESGEGGNNELHGIESGADFYMSKPIDNELLLIRIQALLSKSALVPRTHQFEDSGIRNARILAIDDSSTYLEYLKSTLSEEGYLVTCASSGQEGLVILSTQSFDCILVDLVMPGLDGIQVCNEVSKKYLLVENPVVLLMLTAHENKDEMTRGLAAGADDFVGKSSDLAVLKARIRALLRRKFLQAENKKILEELKNRELEFIRTKANQEIMEARAALVDTLEKTATDLKISNDQLKVAEEKALDAAKAKSEFLAQMSHEIRTPINGVLGMTGLLLDTALNEEQKEYADTIQISAETLLSVINDILDFSKIEAGKLDFEQTDFELRPLINNTIRSLAFLSKQRGNVLTELIAEDVPARINGDSGRLRQIITNLISNSIKFTHQGKVDLVITSLPPRITASGPKISLRFEVIDTGIGIPEGALDRMFKAFSQVDASTTRKYGGTGLGLSICKRLVEMMGGEIGVESKMGKGSMFWFQVSFSSPSAEVQEAPKAALGTPAIQVLNELQSRVRILVAEDNSINQKIAIKMLEKMGFRADAVANGQEVLEALNTIPYDLVLMDCQMPEMDGYEATSTLRKSQVEAIRKVPVIAMTANAMKGDREKCLSAGMNDYVTKPIGKEELERVIFHWLTQTIPQQKAI